MVDAAQQDLRSDRLPLAVLSNSRLSPAINWTTLGPPLLEALACRAGSRLVSPPPPSLSERSAWFSALRQVRGAKTIFWMQSASRPELPLWGLSASRPRARKAAFVIDPFQPLLTKIGILAVAQRLDPCYISYREACEELHRRFPRGRFEWLPFGIDTNVFRPGEEERDVFAYWMGRRDEPLHRALLAYCTERGLEYRYTQRGGEFSDPQDLGALVRRCRYFVVTPPNASRTGGYSPLVMRYLEGLAGGARLLGLLPRSGEFEQLLPRGAICEVSADGSDLAERLDRDVVNAEAWRVTEQASEIVRSEHSWDRRAQLIYERLVGE